MRRNVACLGVVECSSIPTTRIFSWLIKFPRDWNKISSLFFPAAADTTILSFFMASQPWNCSVHISHDRFAHYLYFALGYSTNFVVVFLEQLQADVIQFLTSFPCTWFTYVVTTLLYKCKLDKQICLWPLLLFLKRFGYFCTWHPHETIVKILWLQLVGGENGTTVFTHTPHKLSDKTLW